MKNSNLTLWIFSSLVMLFSACIIYYISPLDPMEYEIKKGINKANNFIDKCSNQYKITIANNNYRISCDAGYIIVKPFVLEEFYKSKK